MKKPVYIFIFIFLTGLFSGIFFSSNLSESGGSYLSSLLLASFSDTSAGFFRTFFTVFISNIVPVLLMLPALATKFLCPLPPVMLWYKSFAIGFCSGLLYLSSSGSAVTISFLRILPQNLFIIPGFLILSVCIFCLSVSETHKKSRPVRNRKGLLLPCAISLGLIFTGCIINALFHLIAL